MSLSDGGLVLEKMSPFLQGRINQQEETCQSYCNCRDYVTVLFVFIWCWLPLQTWLPYIYFESSSLTLQTLDTYRARSCISINI